MNDDISRLINSLQDTQAEAHEQRLRKLDNSRQIYADQLANSANASGVLFSNYAPTKQAQYDANNYMPAVAKEQQTYLTTMDKIISNGRKYNEQFKDLTEKIIEANSDIKK